MWKFSNLNSGCTFWPPDAWQQHNPNSLVYNPCGCFAGNMNVPFPGFRAQEDSISIPSLNLQALNPSNWPLQPGANVLTKRFLVFDQSVEQTSLLIGSVANPHKLLSPNLPTSNATDTCASNGHGMDEVEEMHEDTEEIDALLYSDSECTYDEEVSTGHFPCVMEEEEIDSSHVPAKRCRLDLSELDTSLVGTATSLRASQHPCVLEYMNSGCSKGDESGGENKGDHIQMTMNMLRKIIPGCQDKDAAAVLDEAIRYLDTLKLQAKEYW